MLPPPWTRSGRARWLLTLGVCAAAAGIGPGCLARYSACRDQSAWCPAGDAGGSGGSVAALGHSGFGGTADLGGAAGWGGEGGLGGSGPAAASPTVLLGDPCGAEGEPACGGEASRFVLACTRGVWTSTTQCPPEERCATKGDAIGTCQAVVPECLDKEPGDWVCRGAERFSCGSDLLEEEAIETCAVACVDGLCAACLPNQPPACSNNGVRTCSTAGNWEDTPCPADAPHCSDGACGSPASCIDLAKTCGPLPPLGSGAEDCCTSPLVTGGTFNRENDPALPATISDFRLDRFEVTVGRFRRFRAAWNEGWRPNVGDGKHSHLNDGLGLSTSSSSPTYELGWSASWSNDVDLVAATQTVLRPDTTWSETAGAGENRPMNYVTGVEAQAFCIWDGGFLPTGAEWSYAASGGDEQRLYPWGEEVPAANVDLAVYGCFLNATGTCNGPGNIGSVGSVGVPGKFGQLDLAGNLAEPTLGVTHQLPCIDCLAEMNLVSHQGVRGGWYAADAQSIESASFYERGDERNAEVGFRCARPP